MSGRKRPGIDVDENYRTKRTRDNGWLQDRAAMESGASFSGSAACRSKIPSCKKAWRIYDRTNEHLGASDIGNSHATPELDARG